jgi:hypothetical protein
MAATNRARHPSGSSQWRCIRLSPWRLRRPRRTLMPQRVQWVDHRPVAASCPAPIPRCSRCGDPLVLQIGDGLRRPIQTRWLAFQSPVLTRRCRRQHACRPSTSQYQLNVDSTTTLTSSSRQGSSRSRIFPRSLGNRFCATIRSSSSVTLTTLLFACRSIQLYFISGILR